MEFICSVPHERVVQCHLAGHTNCGTHLIDTHDNHVVDQVWRLYQLAHRLTGGISTLLEWDASIPEFPVVHSEVLKARQFIDDAAGDIPADPDETVVSVTREIPGNVDVRPSPPVPHPAQFVTAEVE